MSYCCCNAMKKLFKRDKDKEGASSSTPVSSFATEKNLSKDSKEQELTEAEFPELPSYSRTLRVEYDAYYNAHTTVHVYDTVDKSSEAYRIDTKYRKPQMTIRSGIDDVVATANFHTLKGRIDMTHRGQPLTLDAHGFLGVQYSYTSAAFNGERMNWRPRKKLDDLNMVLLNEKGIAIARYKPDYRGRRRGGTLEMLSECLSSEAAAEEVVVAALAVMHYKEAQRMSAATSAPATSVVVTS